MADENIWLKLSGLDRQIGFALRHAGHAVFADVRRALEPVGLRPQSYATLLIVGTSPGCKQQDVADALGIQRPNLVALIDGLVTEGMIQRSVNPNDRRSYALHLTPAGEELLSRGKDAHDTHEKRVAVALDGIDVNHLRAVLKRLASL